MKNMPFFEQKRIEDLIDNSRSSICFILDQSGKVTYKNKAFQKILSYDHPMVKDLLINPTFNKLKDLCADDGFFDGIMTFKKVEANISLYGRVWLDKDDMVFVCEHDGYEVESLYMRLKDTTRDINDMNRELIITKARLENTIKELKETQSMLIHSERMNALGHLVAGIAHEINNPMGFVSGNLQVASEYLTGIQGFINELENSSSIEALKESYDMAYVLEDLPSLLESTLNGTERVTKIVSQLRNFSRIDGSEVDYGSIDQSIEDALIIARPQMDHKHISLTLEKKSPTAIECCPSQLNQAFLNMIINSIQATNEWGTMSIRTWESETQVHVAIKDNGVGIPEADLKKIFDAFYTSKDPGEGVGLGLNITHKIITEMHKGRIEVASQVGIGTCFTITIPKDLRIL